MNDDSPDSADDLTDVYTAKVFRCAMGHTLRQREWAERNGACLQSGCCPPGCAVLNRNNHHFTKGEIA